MLTSNVRITNLEMLRDRRSPRPPRPSGPPWSLSSSPPRARSGRTSGQGSRPRSGRPRSGSKPGGHAFRSPVASARLPEKDLERVLGEKVTQDLPTTFGRYEAALVSIGLIDPVADLEKRIVRLYARQVVGFYDPSEKRFYVVPERTGDLAGSLPNGSASLMEDALLVHEITHALQDQRLDLEKRIQALKESTDGLLALQAFLEGEATLVMAEALVSQLPPESRGAAENDVLGTITASLEGGGSGEVEGADGVPELFVRELLFPYAVGTDWVRRKKGDGGWEAIDALYAHLPVSTSELLHPDRPPAPASLLPTSLRPSPSHVPADARLLYCDSLGEWTLRFLLERAGAGDAATTIAAGWQDDRVVFYEPRGDREPDRLPLEDPLLVGPRGPSPRRGPGPGLGSRPSSSRPSIRLLDDVVEVARPVRRVQAPGPS